jgi:hypothetical protein
VDKTEHPGSSSNLVHLGLTKKSNTF